MIEDAFFLKLGNRKALRIDISDLAIKLIHLFAAAAGSALQLFKLSY